MELTQEQQSMVHNIIKEKYNPAWEKMQTFTICRELYNSMVRTFPKQMECFKQCVFWTCVLHPEWSELQIIADVCKGTEIETLINQIR